MDGRGSNFLTFTPAPSSHSERGQLLWPRPRAPYLQPGRDDRQLPSRTGLHPDHLRRDPEHLGKQLSMSAWLHGVHVVHTHTKSLPH